MEKVFFDLTKKDHEKESHRNYVQLILNDDIIYKTDFIGLGKDDKEYKLMSSNIIEKDGVFIDFENKDKQLSFIEWSKIRKDKGLPDSKQSQTKLEELGIIPFKKIRSQQSKYTKWNINNDLLNTDFFAMFVKDNKILGRCTADIVPPKKFKKYGVPNIDPLPQDIDYVYISMVDIHPNHIGKKLCKPLVKFFIEEIHKSNPKYNYMFIYNASKTKDGIPACMCYVKAGVESTFKLDVVHLKEEVDLKTLKSQSIEHIDTDKCLLGKKDMPREYFYIPQHDSTLLGSKKGTRKKRRRGVRKSRVRKKMKRKTK